MLATIVNLSTIYRVSALGQSGLVIRRDCDWRPMGAPRHHTVTAPDPHNRVRIYIACAVYCTVHSPRGSDIRACASLVGQSLSKDDETVSEKAMEKAAFYDD